MHGVGLAASQAKPIKLIVGFPPGTGTRGRGARARRRPRDRARHSGGGGEHARAGRQPRAAALIASPPDGSVITVSALAAYAINPHLYRSVSYNPQGLSPVALVADIPVVLVGNPR